MCRVMKQKSDGWAYKWPDIIFASLREIGDEKRYLSGSFVVFTIIAGWRNANAVSFINLSSDEA